MTISKEQPLSFVEALRYPIYNYSISNEGDLLVAYPITLTNREITHQESIQVLRNINYLKDVETQETIKAIAISNRLSIGTINLLVHFESLHPTRLPVIIKPNTDIEKHEIVSINSFESLVIAIQECGTVKYPDLVLELNHCKLKHTDLIPHECG